MDGVVGAWPTPADPGKYVAVHRTGLHAQLAADDDGSSPPSIHVTTYLTFAPSWGPKLASHRPRLIADTPEAAETSLTEGTVLFNLLAANFSDPTSSQARSS